MAFNLSGDIITQTGTNTSLAGIEDIAGVTLTNLGTLLIYDLGTLHFRVNGTQSINATDNGNREMMVIGTTGTQDTIDIIVQNGGTLNIGHRTTGGTSAISSERFFPSIYEKANHDFGDSRTKSEPSQANLGATNAKGFLVVDAGGTFNWYGCVNCSGGIGFDGVANIDQPPGSNSTVNILDGVWDARRITERGGVGDQFLYNYSFDVTVDGFTVISNESNTVGAALINLTTTNFKGYVPINTELAFTGSTSSANDLQQVIENYGGIQGNTGGTDMTSATNNAVNTNQVKFLNSSKGSTLVFNTQNPGVNSIISVQTVVGSIVDPLGNPVENAVIATENVNGTISQANVVSGQFDLGEILLTEWNATTGTVPPTPTINNPSGTDDDLWSFYLYSFDGEDRSRLDVTLRDLGGKVIDFIQPKNLGVENSFAVTNSFSAIESYQDFHDAAKLLKINNVGLPDLRTNFVLTAGQTNDFGSLDIDIDGNASEAIAYDGSKLIINPFNSPNIKRIAQTSAIVESPEAQQITINTAGGINDNGMLSDQDVLVLVVATAQGRIVNFNTPAGWNVTSAEYLVANGTTPPSRPSVIVYTKEVTSAATEPATVTVDTSTSVNTGLTAQMILYRGIDTSNILDTARIVRRATTGNAQQNNITTATDGAMVLQIAIKDSGEQTLVSAPTGYSNVLTTATTGGAGTGE